MMRRRDVITLLGGAAAWPLAARGQQPKMRRVGVLMNLAADDAEGQARQAAFLQGLQEAGWSVGRNLRIDIRWGNNDPERIRRDVAELVATTPDVILAAGPVMAALQPTLSRSCSWPSPIRSSPATSPASTVRAATSRVSPRSNLA
jgi:putative ABC transport system substrate-binding protein